MVSVANSYFFENDFLLKLFKKDMGYLHSLSFFNVGKRASSIHCFNYWDTCRSFTPFSSFIIFA